MEIPSRVFVTHFHVPRGAVLAQQDKIIQDKLSIITDADDGFEREIISLILLHRPWWHRRDVYRLVYETFYD